MAPSDIAGPGVGNLLIAHGRRRARLYDIDQPGESTARLSRAASVLGVTAWIRARRATGPSAKSGDRRAWPTASATSRTERSIWYATVDTGSIDQILLIFAVTAAAPATRRVEARRRLRRCSGAEREASFRVWARRIPRGGSRARWTPQSRVRPHRPPWPYRPQGPARQGRRAARMRPGSARRCPSRMPAEPPRGRLAAE